MAKYRLNFLTNQGDANYKVLARCYLVDVVGGTTPLNPAGTTFSDSGNNYNADNGFDDGYDGTGSWHSAYGAGGQAYWGIVDFGTNDPQVLELVMTNDSIPARSPKTFSIERYDGTTWVTVAWLDSIPAWTANETRRYRFYHVSGVVRDDTGALASRKAYLIDRGTAALASTAISNATTGQYDLWSRSNGEHIRVVLDDDAGTLRNDIIDRVYPG